LIPLMVSHVLNNLIFKAINLTESFEIDYIKMGE